VSETFGLKGKTRHHMGIEEMRACAREKDRETENDAARKQMKIRKHENQKKKKNDACLCN
jgi:hypothetical protein